ncbi:MULTISPECIES: hypothetical protein [Bacillus]|uniref:hypothetical protein n=1 Tax=Bacillus safensis TaxID=561879 RepID=UPI000F88ED1A|nr:hypothetical protein [Bacillus safensis]MBU5206843.1 hypothetical protein [Bacillus safensis]RUK48983.1 hypothetical protein ELP67_02805 [Bacillus safensis]
MDNEVLIAIIGGVITLLVGVLTAVASYSGARIQIKKSEEKLKKQEKEAIDFSKKIIEKFILREIEDNFYYLRGEVFELDFIVGSSNHKKAPGPMPFEHLNFTEFNKVKYELIKYQSDIITEVIDIYEAFQILKSYQGYVKAMNDNEFQKFKRGFKLCTDRFGSDI